MTTFTPTLSSARVEPATTTTPSTALKVKSATVTFDATWSPFIQGTLVCALQSAADNTATDPRKPMRAKFTLGQTFNGAAQSLNLDAWLRSRISDYGTRETTLTFASAECILQDYASLAGNQYAAAVDDFTVTADVLGGIDLYNMTHTLSRTNPGSTGGFTVAAADAGWDAGTTAWDVINNLEAPKGITMRGDETGVVLARQALDYTADSSTYYMRGSDRVITVTDAIDRDSADWANGVFINYTWNKGLNSSTDYGVASGQPSPNILKTVVINRDGHRTATGEALARANRMVKRGRTLNVTAVADLSLRPNRPVWVGFADQAWFGTLRAVTFRWPDGLMDCVIDITQAG